MPNYQKITIIGHATGEAELRTTQNGKQVANFSVAVNDRNKNVTFYDCSAWGATAEKYVAPYLKKGDAVMVEGEPSLNVFMRKNGDPGASVRISAREVQILSSKGGSGSQAGGSQERINDTHDDYIDDEIPF